MQYLDRALARPARRTARRIHPREAEALRDPGVTRAPRPNARRATRARPLGALTVAVGCSLFAGTGARAAPFEPPAATSTVTATAASPRGTLWLAPVRASVGLRGGWGFCPCFRSTLRADGLAFRWDVGGRGAGVTLESPSLVRFEEVRGLALTRTVARLTTLGAASARWRHRATGAGVGLAWDGITFGGDIDRSYSGLLATGGQVLAPLVERHGVTLDLGVGYSFEHVRINLAPAVTRHLVGQSVALAWHGRRVAIEASGAVRLDAEAPGDDQRLRGEGAATLRVRAFRVVGIEGEAGATLGGLYDPFRRRFGLAAGGIAGGPFLSVAWVPPTLGAGAGGSRAR